MIGFPKFASVCADLCTVRRGRFTDHFIFATHSIDWDAIGYFDWFVWLALFGSRGRCRLFVQIFRPFIGNGIGSFDYAMIYSLAVPIIVNDDVIIWTRCEIFYRSSICLEWNGDKNNNNSYKNE